jgi:hypothetical protein
MVVAKIVFSAEKRQDYCITLLPICAHQAKRPLAAA